MKKHIFPLFFSIFLLILSAFLLTGCGGSFSGFPAIPNETDSENTEAQPSGSDDAKTPSSGAEDEAGTENSDGGTKAADAGCPTPFSHAKPEQAPADTDYVFPETAPFIDDTGKSMQRDGNCLYSYCKGRLICLNTETKETSLLYQTASTHKLNFCLYENDIYFVERTGYDSLDDRDTSLWRIGKDGSDLTLLQDDIVNAGTVRDWCNYSIDIYDNIMYLINYTHRYENGNYITETANLYYRLKNDGSVSEVQEAETLYGMLPYRFSPVYDSDFPTFPHAMRNYGYIFMQDAAGRIYRMEPASGAREHITIDTDTFSRFAFSGDQILMCSSSGEGLSLYSLSDKTLVTANIPSADSISYPALFSSEQGFFLCCNLWKKDPSSDSTVSRFVILHILSDGSVDMPFHDTVQAFPEDFYDILLRESSCIDGSFFYFYEISETEHSLMRFPLNGQKNPAFEKLDSFSSFPTSSPVILTAEEESNTTEIENGSSVSCSVKRLFLEEGTAADRQINQTLAEVYSDFEAEVNGVIADEQELYEEDPDIYDDFDYPSRYDFSLHVSLDYMDDDTIAFCCSYYQYYAYAAHGYYWSDYYVFDRQTGERLSFEDFAGDSSSILKTTRPYVEKAAGWEFDQEMLLDISRFSLSEDGYTLFFAPYDIDCYAAGSFLITIPYEAFEKEL